MSISQSIRSWRPKDQLKVPNSLSTMANPVRGVSNNKSQIPKLLFTDTWDDQLPYTNTVFSHRLGLPPAIALPCSVYLRLALTDLQSSKEPRRNVQKAPAWWEALTFLWDWWIITGCCCGCCCLRFFLGNAKLSNPPRRFSDVCSRLGLIVSWGIKSSPLSRSQNDHHYLPLAFWRERTLCVHAISSFMGIHSAWSYCFRTEGGKCMPFTGLFLQLEFV